MEQRIQELSQDLMSLLRDNLRVAVRTDLSPGKGFYTEVTLYYGDEVITSDHEWTDIV